MRYRSANTTVFSAKYHLVWCPKYRRKVLGGQVAERLKEIIPEVAEQVGAEVLEVEVMPDHVTGSRFCSPTLPPAALQRVAADWHLQLEDLPQ